MHPARFNLLAGAVVLGAVALAVAGLSARAADQAPATAPAPAAAAAPATSGSPASATVATTERPELPIGTPTPPLNLMGADGKTHTWEEYKDAKAIIVVFTCLSCPVARGYEERIVALARDYAPKGVKTVAIMSNDITIKPDDATDKLKARSEEMKYPFVYLVDSTQEVAKTYGARVTPHLFIFGADRKLAYRGRVDDNPDPAKVTIKDARAALDAILDGKPVETAETRAFGCSIKWKKENQS
jgi:peroxiredoxin